MFQTSQFFQEITHLQDQKACQATDRFLWHMSDLSLAARDKVCRFIQTTHRWHWHSFIISGTHTHTHTHGLALLSTKGNFSRGSQGAKGCTTLCWQMSYGQVDSAHSCESLMKWRSVEGRGAHLHTLAAVITFLPNPLFLLISSRLVGLVKHLSRHNMNFRYVCYHSLFRDPRLFRFM